MCTDLTEIVIEYLVLVLMEVVHFGEAEIETWKHAGN